MASVLCCKGAHAHVGPSYLSGMTIGFALESPAVSNGASHEVWSIRAGSAAVSVTVSITPIVCMTARYACRRAGSLLVSMMAFQHAGLNVRQLDCIF